MFGGNCKNMVQRKEISKSVLKRLPGYLAYLKNMPEDAPAHISATALAGALGMGEVQVRKDLALVSDGGRPKIGYLRSTLVEDIESFLGYDNTTDAIIVGAGKLGCALLGYEGFAEYGLNIVAAFDRTPHEDDSGKPVYPMEKLQSFCKRNKILMGIITVPAPHAQEVANLMIECGIKAIWNFAPVRLRVPENVVVRSENLAVSLTALRVQMKNKKPVYRMTKESI